MIKEEIRNIKESVKDLKKFGITVGTVLLIISIILYLTGKSSFLYFGVPGLFLFFSAFIYPPLLKPFNKGWMILAVVLGWFSTRVILSILFYLILTPIGLVAKLAGKDFLDLKTDTTKSSYWIKRERVSLTKTDYERQF